MNRIVVATLACALVSVSSQILAAGDAAAGKTKSAACVGCHGADGNSPAPMYPKLAGQHVPYLESAMKAYKAGERAAGQAAMMKPMMANLSDQDIADLAAFYASQAPK